MIQISELVAGYGQLQVLKSISLHVNEGEIVSVLGANGAGKTTLLRAITGGSRIFKGQIEYKDKDITRMLPHQVAKLRIAHVPDNRQLFTEMTVQENLELSGKINLKSKDEIVEKLKFVNQLFPRLEERRKQLSGTLSGGEQQMVAIGRALMMNPQMLILDEPSQGLAPIIVSEIFEVIKKLSMEGLTIILVEQNIYHALSISGRAYILKNGLMHMEGPADELLQREDITNAYLH